MINFPEFIQLVGFKTTDRIEKAKKKNEIYALLSDFSG